MTKWNTDFGQAPKDQAKFLVKRKDGLVTTAYFYWYTEQEEYGLNKIEMWVLQDAITDQPIDDVGPSLMEMAWMEIPE